MQRWRFLVIRDPKVKKTVGLRTSAPGMNRSPHDIDLVHRLPGTSREQFERMLAAAEYLANHIHEAPVWIVPCLEGGTPTRVNRRVHRDLDRGVDRDAHWQLPLLLTQTM
jgi:hypothetical protein